MGRSSIGLRARLLLLVLAAVVPAFGLIGYTALHQREQAALNAETDAMNLVRVAAMEQRQLIATTRQLLMSLAQSSLVTDPGNAAGCSKLLSQLLAPFPYFTNFGVSTPDGRVFCSALPIKGSVNIADRSYFQRAIESRGFGIGDFQVGRITGIRAVNFGYPALGKDDRIVAVVYAALNLSWLNRLANSVMLPAGSTLAVIDSHGTILARHPEPDRWVGKPVADSPLMQAARNRAGEGTGRFTGLDGVMRLYAYAPLQNGPTGTVYVSVGIPESTALAAANEVFLRNMTLLMLVALVTAAAAWYGSDFFVLRRVRALSQVAQRLARGEFDARSGLPHDGEELGKLARNFDDMAVSLQSVNRALKTLSAGNRTVVRARDEQALLDEMCRVIVKVGDYPFCWVGYAEPAEEKRIRAVAQAGFDSSLEALQRAMGDMTWDDTDRGQDPAAKAIRTESPVVFHELTANPGFEPWQEAATRRGYACAAAFPLRVHGNVIGALSMFARDSNAFHDEEMKLLAEAAEDLAFGIETLRTRAMHERATETIRWMAYYDSLTGLPNHTLLEEQLERAITNAARGKRPLALLILDVDRFGEINDTLGFEHGDSLLKEVGVRIASQLKGDAILARMRGDEFAIQLPDCGVADATEVTARILAAVREPYTVQDLQLDINATIGIAVFPAHSADAKNLIRRADVAMRLAKSAGNSYAVYAIESDATSPRRLALAGGLRQGIEQNQLSLYYQPKVVLPSGKICGVEALARWIHPDEGIIRPDEFIPIAEHTGLIKPLTEWVLAEALRQISEWHKADMRFSVAVNLSARNLHDLALLDRVKRLAQNADGPLGWLEMEITESAIMEDPDGALKVLANLNELGVSLYVDDFGVGYSSLSYLQRLPVDAIKIDRSFIKDMPVDVDSAAIVRSTIALAHDLEIKVVAEGVEDKAVWDQLVELGCDMAQGFLIARPMPADDFVLWLRENPWRPDSSPQSALPHSRQKKRRQSR